MANTTCFDTVLENINGRFLIPLQEATHMLGMKDRRMTLRLVREGSLKTRQLGNRIMITTQSLLEYLGA